MNEKNRPTGMGPAQSLAGGSTVLSVVPATDIDPILARPFDPIYEAKLLAWAQGWEARQSEVDYLNFTADRLYAEICRRVPPKQVDLVPYARLQEIRAEIYAGAK